MGSPHEISLRERIRLNLIFAMENANTNQVQLAEKLGISKGTVNNWVRGNNSPDVDMVPRICNVLKISILDLFSPTKVETTEKNSHTMKFHGTDYSMLEDYKLSDEEHSHIIKYRSLDEHGKNTVKAVLDCEKARCDENASRPPIIPDNILPFRRSIQPVSAGTGAYLGPEEFETIFVLENNLTRRASFGVPVRGDSMEPTYHDGDVLIVEVAVDIPVGEIGVFTVDGEGYVKERGESTLISLNSKYAPIKLTEDTRCNGRVIGILKKEWIVGAE